MKLLPLTEIRRQHRPIDQFFSSLAKHQGEQAIRVILSGTATDGTLGLEGIKAEGGITFVQDNTAQQVGPADLGIQLVNLARESVWRKPFGHCVGI